MLFYCENEVPFLLPGILSRGKNFQALGFDEDCVEEYGGIGHGNDVVKQPLVSELWVASTPDLKMYSVEATHCGFVQQAPIFHGVLAEILG